MARHIVIGGPVDHDGRLYQDGEMVDLSAEAAAALVAAAVVAEVKEPPAVGRKAGKDAKPPSGEE